MDPAVLAVIANLALAVAVLAQMVVPVIKHRNGKGNPGNPNGGATKEQMATVIAKLDSLERLHSDGVSRITRTLHDQRQYFADTHLAVNAAEKLSESTQQMVKGMDRVLQKIEIRLDRE